MCSLMQLLHSGLCLSSLVKTVTLCTIQLCISMVTIFKLPYRFLMNL